MKKIGIVTHYYGSNNYGGNLQAYALPAFINKQNDFRAEQICLDFLGIDKIGVIYSTTKKKPKVTFKKCIIKFLKLIRKLFSLNTYKNIINKILNKIYGPKFHSRRDSILSFNRNVIPHSQFVYDGSTIQNCGSSYDIYITGSDQVWSGPSNEFMLGFVAKNKTKISYAASISRNEISDFHTQFLKAKLVDYRAISVRGETDKTIVSPLTDKQVEVVLDPVFLLDKIDWDSISAHNRYPDINYIFCYFLGECSKYKKIAHDFAKKHKLKIVYLPNFRDNENKVIFGDCLFGDFRPYDVSPSDFITLIREAKFIFTDSFHALAFSLIYNKNFFVFDRISKWGNMSSRIVNLLNDVNLGERFCFGSEKENIEYVSKLNDIDFSNCNLILKDKIKKSQEFLLSNLYEN